VLEDSELITLDEFLSLPDYLEVKLNEEYTAVISSDETVTVGCQKFSFKVIDEVFKAVEEMKLKIKKNQ